MSYVWGIIFAKVCICFNAEIAAEVTLNLRFGDLGQERDWRWGTKRGLQRIKWKKDSEYRQHHTTPLPSTTGHKERPTEHLLSGPAHTVQEQAKPGHSAITPQR